MTYEGRRYSRWQKQWAGAEGKESCSGYREMSLSKTKRPSHQNTYCREEKVMRQTIFSLLSVGFGMRKIVDLQRCPHPNPWTCDYVTCLEKRKSADLMRVLDHEVGKTLNYPRGGGLVSGHRRQKGGPERSHDRRGKSDGSMWRLWHPVWIRRRRGLMYKNWEEMLGGKDDCQLLATQKHSPQSCHFRGWILPAPESARTCLLP